MASCTVTSDGKSDFDGFNTVSVRVGKQCDLTVLSIDVGTKQDLAGQSVYFLVHANITLPDTGLSLSINGAQSSDSYSTPGLSTFSFQATLSTHGTARFGLRVFTSAAEANTVPAVEIGTMVVSKVGNDWSRLLLD